MSMIIGALRAVFGADTAAFEKGVDDVERKLKSAERKFGSFGKKIASAGNAMSIGFTAPLVAVGALSFKTATDMQELESAFDVTFGNSAESMRDFAKETATAMGRSRKEIQESSVAFASLFNKALDPGQANALTKEFAILTQDLASFKNLSNEVAQQKLFSGLTGEAEPLKSVGVFINAAATEAKALELGLEKVNGKYTDQQKIVARAALIQEQLSDANGDVIKTFDSTANQLKRAEARFIDVKIAIGTQLLPVITPMIEKVADLFDWFANLDAGMQQNIIITAAVVAGMGPMLSMMGNMVIVGPKVALALVKITSGMSAMGVASSVALGPIGLILAAVAALAVAYESAGEASRKSEAAIKSANGKVDSYIKASKDLQTDTALLKTKTDELNKSIKGSGTAAQDAARLEIDAIRQRIQKNKELQRIYLDDAKLQLQKAQEVSARADNKQLVKLTGAFEDKSKAYGRLRKGEKGYREALEERFKLELDGLRASIDGGELLSKKERKRFEKLNDYFLDRENRAQSVLEIEERIASISKDDGTKFKPASSSSSDSGEIDEETVARVEAAKAAEMQAKAAKKLAEAHVDVKKSTADELRENKLLAEALQQSSREYDITAEKLKLVEDGFRGTDAEARAMAISLVESREHLEGIRQAANDNAAALKEQADEQKRVADAMAESVQRAVEAHNALKQSHADEIESNRLLTEAMRISSREYDIVTEQLNILASGFAGTRAEARAMAEELIVSREALEAVTEATKKSEEQERKLKEAKAETGDIDGGFEFSDDQKGLEDFTNTLNAANDTLEAFEAKDWGGVFSGVGESIFAAFGQAGDAIDENGKKALETLGEVGNQFGSLLDAIQGGDWLDILAQGLGLIGSLFGESDGGFGGGEGSGFADILGGFSGIFGGGKATGGPVAKGVTYLVGEQGPELFTPPSAGNIVPNDKLGGGVLKVEIDGGPMFAPTIRREAAGVAAPIAEVTTTRGVGQYNRTRQRSQKQRLA